jgi:hypothetical protein
VTLRAAVWLRPPEVAVTVAVYVPAGVPSVLCEEKVLLPPQATHDNTAIMNSGASMTGARLRLWSAVQPRPASIIVYTNVHSEGTDPGGCPVGESIAEVEGAVVLTSTATDFAMLPLICSDELDKLQVGPRVTAGVTVQLRFTVPLNDPDPARLRLKLALCPGLTVCDVAEPGVTLKSGAAWITRDTAELFTIEPALPFTCTG